MARLSSVKLMASESKELLIQPQQLQSRVSRDWEQKTRQKTILRGSVKRCNESQRRGTRSFEVVITVQACKTADGSLRTKMLLSKQDSLNIQKRARKFGVWKSYLRNKHIFPIGIFIVNASLKILITEVMLNCDSGSDWDSIQLGKFGCFKQGIEA